MIKLQTDSLREFQKRAATIQSNKLFPILSNLKIQMASGACTITKNAINAVVTGTVECVGNDCVLLVDEGILFSILSTTRQDKIELYIEDGQVVISDEDKTRLPLEDITKFPALPSYSADAPTVKFELPHLSAINIASSYINNSKNAGHFGFVHLGNKSIFAFHSNYFYINSSFENLPTVNFSSEETAVLSTMSSVIFIDLPNHHIFTAPGCEYIFTKTETNKIDINQVVDRLLLPGKEFSIQLTDLNVFIQRANSISESPVTTCSLSPAEPFIKLSMTDANYSRSNERMIPCIGSPDEFIFNSKLVASPLAAIPYQEIKAKTNQNCLIINSGSEWFCFIGMNKI